MASAYLVSLPTNVRTYRFSLFETGKGPYYVAMGDLKRMCGFRNVAKRSFEFVLPASSLARVTLADILSNIFVHSGPPVSQ
jgi:hypothetical protein